MGTGIGDWHRLAADGARYVTRTRATGTYDRQSRRWIGTGNRVARAESECVEHLRHFGRVLPHTDRRADCRAQKGYPRRSKDYVRIVGAGKVIPLEFHATGIVAGARGYPRCPDTAISTAGILAEIGEAWGPLCLSPHVQQRINWLRAWATVPGDGDPECLSGREATSNTRIGLGASWGGGPPGPSRSGSSHVAGGRSAPPFGKPASVAVAAPAKRSQ